MKQSHIVRRGLSLLLVLLLTLSLMSAAAFASEDVRSGADYTTVFVHGLMGWGDDDGLTEYFSAWGWGAGNLPDYLTGLGYDVAVASVGPFSSAWDRCCELFAQLTGTRVDYGQAHADSITAEFAAKGIDMTHDRYGRTYAGNSLISGWGPVYEGGKVTGWYDSKINLVGHSFGGPTSVMFLQLLAEGNAEEIAWGKAQAGLYGGDWHDYVSPLFWGDYEGEKLIHSVTSLAGVLNGTTFISANDGAMGVLRSICGLLANTAGVTDLCRLYDPQLEQFGLTAVEDAEGVFSLLYQSGFINGTDNALYDLTIEGTNRLKQGWTTYDSVYYFSYAGDKTCQATVNGTQVQLPDADMWAILLPFAGKMGTYVNPDETVLDVNGCAAGYADASWQANDGMVNTISARYPLGAAHTAYDANHIVPGTWLVHEDEDYDHFEFIGGIYVVKPMAVRAFYKGIMADIARTAAAEPAKALETPQLRLAGRGLLGSVLLNWKPVSGAACYAVYRATAENGPYTKIATVPGSAYTDLTAARRTAYYYKLVALPYGTDRVSSDFSAPVRAK